MLRITAPTKDENRFSYRIKVAGLDRTAFLTYELPEKADHRTILMVDSPEGVITQSHRSEYQQLMDHVLESSERLLGAKNVVNRILDNELSNLKNARIAIHKFGPVPVFILPEFHKIRFMNKDLDVQIGVYPDARRPSSSNKVVNYRLPFLTSNTEFVRSLQAGLGIMLQRYFEDIGEAMYDIKHHLNLSGVFARAIEIEQTLGRSINSKLRLVTPSPLNYRNPPSDHEKLVNDIFDENIQWVLTARYASAFALFFLNELYRIVGLESRSEQYVVSFSEIPAQFDEIRGRGFTNKAITELPQIQMLCRAVEAYWFDGRERLNELDTENEPIWIKRFIQFARFIAALDDEQLTPTIGRLFISYNHDVPATEILHSQIESYVSSKYPQQLKVLSVRARTPRERFRRKIKANIWLSDSVGGIVPRSTIPISGGPPKGYFWIAREAEYGLLLGKPVLYFFEDGVDRDAVSADLTNQTVRKGLIPSTARVPEGLERKLAESLTDLVNGEFSVSGLDAGHDSLDPRVREVIDREATQVMEQRQVEILKGYFNQFSPDARRTLRDIQELVPAPDSDLKSRLVQKLLVKDPDRYRDEKGALLAFNRVWEKVKKRSPLIVNGKKLKLMKLVNGKRYSANLAEFIGTLQPGIQSSELQRRITEILRKVTTDEVV